MDVNHHADSDITDMFANFFSSVYTPDDAVSSADYSSFPPHDVISALHIERKEVLN